MIFIVVKFTVREEHRDEWLDKVAPFTEATRGEDGNMFFDWSRSVDDPNQFILVEAFQDGAAEAHVGSDHFKEFVAWAPDYVACTPQIVSQTIDGQDGWSQMGEIEPRR